MKPLKYMGYAIVCEEVPNEISLAFNISGCLHQCDGCHSPYLWEYKGDLLSKNLDLILNDYCHLITCVCFLGGDQNLSELQDTCRYIKQNYKLKICIYSGRNNVEDFQSFINENIIDYLKIGKYISDLGGLNKPGTNQIMYMIKNKELEDITYMFQKQEGDLYGGTNRLNRTTVWG